MEPYGFTCAQRLGFQAFFWFVPQLQQDFVSALIMNLLYNKENSSFIIKSERDRHVYPD